MKAMKDLSISQEDVALMMTLIVDSDGENRAQIKQILTKLDPTGSHETAADLKDASAKLSDEMQIVFLGIKLPDANGIEAAQLFLEKYPRLNIIFVTAHPEYALEAHHVHPSGFLLKPVTEEDIGRELRSLRNPIEITPCLRVQCSHFAVFIDDDPFDFRSKQTRELFAYLVYKNGAICSNGELLNILWEGDVNKGGRLRQLIMDMKASLERTGVFNVLVKKYGRIGIDPRRIIIQGDPKDIRNEFQWHDFQY